MFKKYEIKLNNIIEIEKIKIAFALIHHRPFAKWHQKRHFTYFFLTKKEYEEFITLTEKFI